VAFPIFDVVPIIQSRDGIRIGVVTVAGVSTAHNSSHTDNGKMYADIVAVGGGSYRLDLWSDYARGGGSLVARGTAPAVGQYFAIAEQNASGITGRARLDGEGAPVASPIVVVSFAVDADLFKEQNDAASLPGYDTTFGLAAFHAAAMRRLLTSDLPSAVPELFRGKKLAAFTPLALGTEFPDLSQIQNPESLRDAQANLVKSLSAQEAEHLEEFRELAELARERFAAAIGAFRSANAPAVEAVATANNAISFGTWRRG
jgi:hypothetical protein